MKYNNPSLTSLVRKLSLIGLIIMSSLSLIQAAPPPSSFGVWDRRSAFDQKEYPFLKGLTCNLQWADVEQKPGVFDWSKLDADLQKAVAQNEFIYLALEAGPASPDWIYEQGVPKVITDDTKHKGPHWYPYYASPAYLSFYDRVLSNWVAHIQQYPKEMQERIAFVQVKTGSTGDEAPYKGKPKDSRYTLDKQSNEWQQFRLRTFEIYKRLFQPAEGLKIDLLFNDLDINQKGAQVYKEEWDWCVKNLPGGFGIKNGKISRNYHLSGERSIVEHWTPYLVDPKGLTLFRREEMDGTWERPWVQKNLPLNFYWFAINALNGGQSIWDVQAKAVVASKEQHFDYAFYFFNRYAGQIYPKTATDAFCALHKGLDAADTNAYPEAKFGAASRNNIARMHKICDAFARYGAKVRDEGVLASQNLGGDEAKDINDVGWDIWPDNYGRFLYQIDADATSIPLWEIGGQITKSSSIYSRFARGFEHASGKDAMYFKLHDGFSQGSEPKVMSLTVVWYDAQAGSTWKLDYDAGKPTMKTGLSVTGKGDKQWHFETVTLNDAVLRHGGTKGSDLALVNTDAKDDIVSLIEVHRGEPEMPALRPPTNNKVSDSGAPNASKAGKTKRGKKNKTEGAPESE